MTIQKNCEKKQTKKSKCTHTQSILFFIQEVQFPGVSTSLGKCRVYLTLQNLNQHQELTSICPA